MKKYSKYKFMDKSKKPALNTRLAQKCLFGIFGFRKTPFGLSALCGILLHHRVKQLVLICLSLCQPATKSICNKDLCQAPC